MAYAAGAAKVDLTPPTTIPYLGGLPRHSPYAGVHDALHARAVAFGETGGETVVLVSVDALGINNAILGPGRHFTDEVRAAIEAATGVPPSHVMVTSSHTHSSPETADFRPLLDTPGAGAWLEGFAGSLVDAAVRAVEDMRPVTARRGTGEVLRGTLAINRNSWSYPDPDAAPDDPELDVLVLEAPGWSAVLYSFATHPVIVQVQPYASADFPGVASDLVERNVPGCRAALFLQGACGNLAPPPDPLTHDENGSWRSPFDAEHELVPDNVLDAFAHAERMGMALGVRVVEVVEEADHVVSGPVAARSQRIDVASRDLPDRAPFQAELEARRQALAEAVASGAPRLAVVALTEQVQSTEEELVAIDRGTDPIPAEVQVLRLGDVACAGLPGEPFVELGLGLKALSDDGRRVLAVGYANDYLGYLTDPDAWDRPLYEVSLGAWTRVGRTGGAELAGLAAALVDQLWSDVG
ncbi:neutral/alkaline non-lysosomal ceramidase N-terminal domain-containing protein [Actinosynnema sp. NPDC050436]|uniref:neutral/alkaline non-lysosomal ceramidase N-terminal domain-containing protein n=1 Tax=Actinosynnema sp. NPDC050436 TaxID=3155659 RepID=UPI0033F0F53F